MEKMGHLVTKRGAVFVSAMLIAVFTCYQYQPC